jgi:hypothetical protein
MNKNFFLWGLKVGGVKMKKKTHFVICKNVFSLQLFSDWSLGFAFQRWFVELENVLLRHFKSLKMEKITSCNIIVAWVAHLQHL